MNIKPERTESVQIKMKLDKAAYDRHEEAVKTLIPNFAMQLVKNDSLNVDYKFYINYWGDVARKLAAVKVMCMDSDVVIEANCEMLTDGRILAYEVFRELDSIIRVVKERDGERPSLWRRMFGVLGRALTLLFHTGDKT